MKNNIDCFLNCVIQGDARNVLKKIPDNSIDLIITSPPYFNQRDYSQFETFDDYLKFISSIMKELYRVLKTGSVICWNIGDDRSVDLPSHSSIELEEAGFDYLDTIIWVKPGQQGKRGALIRTKRRYYPYFKHEFIFVYSKGKFNKNFDKDALPLATKSNTTVWHIKTKRNEFEHPAQFHPDLPTRCIRFYSNKEDVVLDPFIGSGTTAIAAKQLRRNYIGIDKKTEYVQMARERLRQKNLFSNIG